MSGGGGAMQVTALSKQNEFLKGYIVRLQRQLEVSVIVIIGVGVGVGVGVSILASSVQFSSCVDLLRALVQRSNSPHPCACSQDYLGSYLPPPSSTSEREAEQLAPWVGDTTSLSPLLEAYDRRIAEADAAYESLSAQQAAFQGRARQLTAENERLMAEVKQLTSMAVSRAEEGDVGLGLLGGEGSSAKVLEMEEKVALLTSENDVMVDECKVCASCVCVCVCACVLSVFVCVCVCMRAASAHGGVAAEMAAHCRLCMCLYSSTRPNELCHKGYIYIYIHIYIYVYKYIYI